MSHYYVLEKTSFQRKKLVAAVKVPKFSAWLLGCSLTAIAPYGTLGLQRSTVEIQWRAREIPVSPLPMG